jgi:hypothetical protein
MSPDPGASPRALFKRRLQRPEKNTERGKSQETKSVFSTIFTKLARQLADNAESPAL